MARRSSGSTRLPKAPLAEVVFEMRWGLQRGPENQPVLQSDPGILPLLDAFTAQMKKSKFGFFRDMSHPLQTGPYGVVRRYFLNSDAPYPIMQVGAGIFATNASSQYEYAEFRKQVLSGIAALLNSYPKMDFFALHPDYLELRYVDVFDQTVMEGLEFFSFLAKETGFKLDMPPMLKANGQLVRKAMGRIVYDGELKSRKGSRILADIGSATHGTTNEDALQMVTIVRSVGEGVPKLSTKSAFTNQVAKWLDFAHGITSPLFKEIVSDRVMHKFKEL